jgi:hypothetical protein
MDCFVASTPRNDVERPAPRAEISVSRQPPLAAQPDPLLGFQLRHLDQMGEDAESVTARQPGKVGKRLGNEAGGFIRSAVPWLII